MSLNDKLITEALLVSFFHQLHTYLYLHVINTYACKTILAYTQGHCINWKNPNHISVSRYDFSACVWVCVYVKFSIAQRHSDEAHYIHSKPAEGITV